MAVKKRLLIVDDDEPLREELVEQFALYKEFDVTDVGTATEGIKATEDGTFDLILLDVDLPDMLGTEACQLMRAAGVASPVVMLTGNDGDMNEILGLNSGANDYVTKPFKFAVLLARLRAHLRSFEQSEDAVFQVGPYEFAPAYKKLTPPTVEGEKPPRDIRLTEKETNILKYLYRAGGKPVDRLRQKIEPEKGVATLLVTEPGGYRLELG